jgi:DNA-binding response OmpR family regulator
MKNILLVDDSPLNRAIIEKALAGTYSLSTAATGADTFKALSSGSFDLIILDIIMPDMDGYEILSRIRASEHSRNIPVIFVTSRTSPEDIQKGLDAGANDYLPKPVSLPELRARVDSQLRLKEMSRIMAGIERLKTAKALTITLKHEIVNGLANISALNHMLQLRKGTDEENLKIEENILRLKSILDRIDALEDIDFENYTPSAPEGMVKL